MGRLIGFIVILAVFLVFIGLNLENRCDIRYWFAEDARIQNIPVYLTAFGSFVLGMLCAVPFIISFRRKKGPGKDPSSPKFGWGKKNKAAVSPGQDAVPGQNGPYGID